MNSTEMHEDDKKVTQDNLAIENFREYLRINTSHPTPDYESAIAFLQEKAAEIGGLKSQVIRRDATSPPNLLIIWEICSDDVAHTPTILLNSHMDVVPAESAWQFPAFAGFLQPQTGNIYGRGAQDMKCVGIQYLEAIRRLKSSWWREAGCEAGCNLAMSFVSGEETGDPSGMETLVDSPEFARLNVILAMDEGIANPSHKFSAFYNERQSIWAKFTFEENSQNGSRIDAFEAFTNFLDRMFALRRAEQERFRALEDPSKLGEVTTLNLTQVCSQSDPPNDATRNALSANPNSMRLSATFDIRIPPTQSLQVFEEELSNMAGEAGRVELLMQPIPYVRKSKSEILESRFWQTFIRVCDELRMPLELSVFPGSTDAEFFREQSIPVINFSPMNDTPILLHDSDEFLNKDVFLRGIKFYEAFLAELLRTANDT